jgi:hypothetical protein
VIVNEINSVSVWERPTLMRIFGSSIQASDKKERAEMVSLMTSVIHDGTFPIADVAELLVSNETSCRESGARVLSELGTSEISLLPLVPSLLKDCLPDVRLHCIDWLIAFRGTSVPIADALRCAAEHLDDPDGSVRWKTRQLIDHLDDNTFKNAFSNSISYQVGEIANAKGESGRLVQILGISESDADRFEKLRAALCDPLPSIRMACLLAARRAPVGCDGLIIDGAHDVNSDVRATAISVGRSFPSTAGAVIESGLGDSDRLVKLTSIHTIRKCDIQSLQSHSGSILSHIIACLEDIDEGVRTAAIDALNLLPVDGMRKAMMFVAIARHSTERVRRRALRAIEEVVLFEPLISDEVFTAVVEIIANKTCDQKSRRIGTDILFQRNRRVREEGGIGLDLT